MCKERIVLTIGDAVRSPMAQAYLQYLLHQHETLATNFSRVLSAGLAASKPGVPISAGVDFMLRDYGICDNFVHISRRLERRDVEKFEYVLTMNTAQRDEVLATWPSRDESSTSSDVQAGTLTREDLEEKVRVLGSFGNEEAREVPSVESIYGEHWFFIGTKRIYPGYDKCFHAIKAFVGDFVYEMTGFDVHAHKMSSSQEVNSRNMSQEVSDDEGYSGVWQSPQWSFAEERSGFEELSRAISHCT
jgi:protein-tyrosine-phosphatase